MEAIDPVNLEAIQETKSVTTAAQAPKMGGIQRDSNNQFGGHYSIPYGSPFPVAEFRYAQSSFLSETLVKYLAWGKMQQVIGNFN